VTKQPAPSGKKRRRTEDDSAPTEEDHNDVPERPFVIHERKIRKYAILVHRWLGVVFWPFTGRSVPSRSPFTSTPIISFTGFPE